MPLASSRAAPTPTAPTDIDAQLASLRAELDRIDDALHDGLMRRAALVAQVGALRAKGPVPLRPGREASILRRLVARNHGALSPATVVRVWRELLAGSSAQQSPMRIVVGDPALRPAVCEHFGALAHADGLSPAACIAQLRDGAAALAVLPMPGDGAAWWVDLLDAAEPRVHVVARLPFWSRPSGPEALVVSAAAPDPSGADRSLVAGPAVALSTATILARDGDLALAERDGFMTDADARDGLRVIGAYAIPMGDVR